MSRLPRACWPWSSLPASWWHVLAAPGLRPRGAARRVPRRHGQRRVPRLRQPQPRVVCKPDTAPADRQDARRAGEARNKQPARAMRVPLHPGRDQHHREAQDVRLRAARRLRGAASGRSSTAASTAPTSRPTSDDPLLASQYIGSISEPGQRPEPDGRGRGTRRQTNPIALSYADQRRCPHNLNLISIFGDRDAEEQLDRLRQRVLRHPDRRHRRADDRRDHRQQFQQLNAFRLDRAGGVVIRNLTVQQAEFNSRLRAGDRRLRARHGDDARQRRVRHPRVRLATTA